MSLWLFFCLPVGSSARSRCESSRLSDAEAVRYRGSLAERRRARQKLSSVLDSMPRCVKQAMPLYIWTPRNSAQSEGWGNTVNFGDDVNCPLFRSLTRLDQVVVTHLAFLPAERNLDRKGKVLLVGTTLKSAQDFDVVVGVGGEDRMKLVSHPSLYSVRGVVTLEKLKEDNFSSPSVRAVADPALFASLLIPEWFEIEVTGGGGVCLVANGADERLKGLHRDDLTHIAHDRPAVDVARDIAKCDMVVASALHGIIFADALGIPSILPSHWAYHPFKVYDYFSAVTSSPEYFLEEYRANKKRRRRQQKFSRLREPYQTSNTTKFVYERHCRGADGAKILPHVTFRQRVAMAEAYLRSFPIEQICYTRPEDVPEEPAKYLSNGVRKKPPPSIQC